MSEEKAKPNRKLLAPQFVSAEYHENPWIAKPEAGTTFVEMLDPAYWANVASQLRSGDVIRVRPVEGNWWAQLVVAAVAPFTAKVEFIIGRAFGIGTFTSEDDFAKAVDGKKDQPPVLAAVGPKGYEIKNRGKNGWTVVRKSDNAVLKEGLDTQAAALAWAEQHAKTFA